MDAKWMAEYRTLSRASAHPIAPHVASRLMDLAGDDREALEQLPATLTAGQLSGEEILPSYLPAAALPANSMAAIEALSTADRRVLLLAALMPVRRASLLLAASALDLDLVVIERLQGYLEFADGRFRVRDPLLRSAVLRRAAGHEIALAHDALARVSRRDGAGELSAWHSAQGLHPNDEGMRALIRVAVRRLDRGDADAAQRVGTIAARALTGAARGEALDVAARAALWAGNLGDALSLARAALAVSSSNSATATRKIAMLLQRGADGTEGMAQRLISFFLPIRAVVTAHRDEEIFPVLFDLVDSWATDPQHADALGAQVAAITGHAHIDATRWSQAAAPTPLGEAHVRLLQAGFLLQGGEQSAAARVICEAIPRLPLTIPGAGIVAGLVKDLPDEILDAWHALAPQHRVEYVREGPRIGARTAAMTQLDGAFVAETGAAPPSFTDLTEREHEVVTCLLRGCSNHAIAETLGISSRTVEVHLTSIYRKAGVRTRAELLASRGERSPEAGAV